jgi:octaheme c-type cytochrome (tetrathionate reductase family)
MKISIPVWLVGLGIILAVIIVPIFLFGFQSEPPLDDPQAFLKPTPIHTSHADIITGPLESAQEVTRNCLTCHPDAAAKLMQTTHWTWESEPFTVPGTGETVTIGKINQINNFCISTQGNQKKCMSCHVGYGWEEGEDYDFSLEENVDCLVCHADTTAYAKGEYGEPAEGIDLLAAARSVRMPTRDNCGKCHFDGGGGNGVKHGDLDESLFYPNGELDVHMGSQDFLCTTCHTTKDHQIKGRLVADNYTIEPQEQVACTDCHSESLHDDERINNHVKSVACQTCHIPFMAVKDPTKISWDWSTAGQDIPDDHFTYLKIKGTFVYEQNVEPTYIWFNGDLAYRYIVGDKIDPQVPTMIDLPAGDIDDPQALVSPFKIHVAKQPYDAGYNYLLAPITAGDGGYWSEFDWDKAFRLAEDVTGLAYSGQYGFAETWMYWPTTHMVQPSENALQCTECHSPDGRMDWEALGYHGDPMEWGGRFSDQ